MAAKAVVAQVHPEKPSAAASAARSMTARTSPLLEVGPRVRGGRQLPPPPPPRRRGGALGHDFANVRVYAKREVGAPDDPYEREADRIAQSIMTSAPGRVQRACACGTSCAKCQKKEAPLQRAVEPQAPASCAAAPESVLSGLGPG